jgi:hypothetical protein
LTYVIRARSHCGTLLRGEALDTPAAAKLFLPGAFTRLKPIALRTERGTRWILHYY